MIVSSAQAPASRKDCFPFLQLPHEVRDMIYDKLFFTNDNDIQLCTQLLHVNRQINLEATQKMSQNCIFVLVEIRDLHWPIAVINRCTSELDIDHWDSHIETASGHQPLLPHHRTTNPETGIFPGEHFKHYSMRILLKPTEEHETGSPSPMKEDKSGSPLLRVERVMLLGKATLNRFARQVLLPEDYITHIGAAIDSHNDVSIAIEILPSPPEVAQSERDSDLLEPLKAHWWNLKSITITGMTDSNLSEAAVQNMMRVRWASSADWVMECRKVLEDVLAAISVRDDDRAIEACAHGEVLTEGVLVTEDWFPLDEAHNNEISDHRFFFFYYWTKLKIASVCSSMADLFKSGTAIAIHIDGIKSKILSIYNDHILSTVDSIAGARAEGSVRLSSDAECAELLYELFNLLGSLGLPQAAQRLQEAIETNPQDFRARTASAMLQEKSFKLLPVTMGSTILWEPGPELPKQDWISMRSKKVQCKTC